MRQALTMLVLSGTMVLSGCATRPESIQATDVSPEQFTTLDCPQLAVKLSNAKAELVKLSQQQTEKADTDALGVFLFGIPASPFTGDHEQAIARLKGEVAAIESVQARQKCNSL